MIKSRTPLIIAILITVSIAGYPASADDTPGFSPGNGLFGPDPNLTRSIATAILSFSIDNDTGDWSAWNPAVKTGIRLSGDGEAWLSHKNGSLGIRFADTSRNSGQIRHYSVLTGIKNDGRLIAIERDGIGEWYRNSDGGIEHGMVLHARPAGNGILVVSFSLSGDLVPSVKGRDLVFSDRYGPVLAYSGLKVVDASGKSIPSSIGLSGAGLSWQIDDTDAVYPLAIDPVVTEYKVLSPTVPAEDDGFGNAVAIYSDVAVVGVPYASSGGDERGRAYVFYKDTGGTNNWGQVRVLTPSNPADRAYFGGSVAVSGDYIVIGGQNASIGSTSYGLAYLFIRDLGGADNWGQLKILLASDRNTGDHFGKAVAVSGDVIAVGAPDADSGGTSRGQVYVYTKNQGGANNWGELKILTASDAVDNDYFGFPIAMSGDTILVGVPGKHNELFPGGFVYLFQKDYGGVDNWGQFRALRAWDGEFSDSYGSNVAISGNTMVIGALYADGAGTNRGEAYVYDKYYEGGSDWNLVKTLSPPDIMDNDYFGSSVGIAGAEIVVGAQRSDSGGDNSGQVYTFSRNRGGINNWGQERVLIASDRSAGDYFGKPVAISSQAIFVGTGKDKVYVFTSPPAEGPGSIGVFRPSTHTFYLDYNGNGVWNGVLADRQYTFGLTGDSPVSGDWDNDGYTEIGVFRNSTHRFYLDYNGNGIWDGALTDRQYTFGMTGDSPISGDWDNDEYTEIGVFRNSTHRFYLDYNGNGIWDGALTDRQYNFGVIGDSSICGDWNGNIIGEIGVFRNSTHRFYLDYKGNGIWDGAPTDRQYNFGMTGDTPISGDWSREGSASIGVFRNSTHRFYLDYNGNGLWDGALTDRQYTFGMAADLPVIGKWG